MTKRLYRRQQLCLQRPNRSKHRTSLTVRLRIASFSVGPKFPTEFGVLRNRLHNLSLDVYVHTDVLIQAYEADIRCGYRTLTGNNIKHFVNRFVIVAEMLS
jgi:hypothetical protein